MRTINIIFIAAAIVAAGFLMLRSRHLATDKPAPHAVAARAAGSPPPKYLPLNQVKMVTVAASSKALLHDRANSAWSDIELIVDSGGDIHERLEAISHLPTRLSDADWAVLRKFLLTPDPYDRAQMGQVLKNVLMDKLCGMTPSPAGLGAVFARMATDFKQNEVVRDYAIQHVTLFDEGLAGQKGANVLKEEKADQKVLWNALFETGDSIAGTALLGLEQLSQAGEQVDSNQLSGIALEMANDPNAGELTLSTAYQVCAKRNIQQALQTIEAAAQSSETVSLQISAIGALGAMGGANDLPLLQNLLQENQDRLKLPARTAINHIQQRLQLQVSVR